MIYGYATRDRDLSMQLRALEGYGCDEIIYRDNKPIYRVIEMLEPNDELVLWRIDKIASDIEQAGKIISLIERKGAILNFLFDSLNTKYNFKEISQLIEIMQKVESL